jgi:hypothetical protein
MVPLIGSQAARAQTALGNGHALDANNQVGSGGINGAVNNGPLVTPNDIVYGNVTGGFGFQGPLHETDPLAFRGILPGSGVDSFTAGSSGVPTAYAPQFSLSQPRPFYADSRGVAPPAGSVILGFNGSGVGTDLTTSNPYAGTPGLDALASQRLGSTNIVGVTDAPSLLAMPGSPGSADPTMQAALLGSPLYGVRLSSDLQQGNDLIVSSDSAASPVPLAPSSLDDQTLLQIRQQMQGTSSTVPQALSEQGLDQNNPNNPNNSSDQNSGVNPLGGPGPISPLNPSGRPQVPGSLNNGPLQMPLNSAIDSSVSSGRLGGQLQTGQLGKYREGNSPLPLASPAVYSPAYQRMLTLVRRFNVQTSSPTARKGAAAPTTNPANGAGSGAQIPGVVAPANAAPVKIINLADSIDSKAKMLRSILASGDDALKQGKYKTAIDQYTAAIRVAPNNMLFLLGRANAEIGAGYYAQAEMDIRRAVFADPTVLMAQFDLPAMMSADRLQFAQKDLQDLTKDARASRPWFLLSYLAYNGGDTNAAASDLEEAKKRTGSNDPVIRLMEKYWSLPGASAEEPKPDMNK